MPHKFYILVIDDSTQLRSLLARHIMLSCTNRGYSCGIYRLGERAEPTLTFAQDPQNDNYQQVDRYGSYDFAVLEAGSPRHALNWLRHSGVRELSVISDVMMPVDTEVGLPGFLNGLVELKAAVNLIFMSSEPQNLTLVQLLMRDQNSFFLIKGSDTWNRMPEALIAGIQRVRYRQLPPYNYEEGDLFKKPDLQPVAFNGRPNSTDFLAIPPNSLGNSLPARAMAPANLGDSPGPPVRQPGVTRPVPPPELVEAAPTGSWSRFRRWLSNLFS